MSQFQVEKCKLHWNRRRVDFIALIFLFRFFLFLFYHKRYQSAKKNVTVIRISKKKYLKYAANKTEIFISSFNLNLIVF